MPGDFTNRFDKEILRSKMAELDEAKSKFEKEKQELEKIERDLGEIGQILDRRAGFLRERFANSKREELGGVGFRFSFAPTADRPRSAIFSLRARANESRLAILIESNFEIPEAGSKEYDYITIAVAKMDFDRAKQFVEAKLLDFARAYTA
jgi:hypothetical protein